MFSSVQGLIKHYDRQYTNVHCPLSGFSILSTGEIAVDDNLEVKLVAIRDIQAVWQG